MQILLLEDDPLSTELVVAVLEDEGYAVTVAANGMAGSKLAIAEHFDLIICDIELPLLRGDAVCRDLRARGQTVPIIALSAHASRQYVGAALLAGFTAFEAKPITPAKLREVVRQAVTADWQPLAA